MCMFFRHRYLYVPCAVILTMFPVVFSDVIDHIIVVIRRHLAQVESVVSLPQCFDTLVYRQCVCISFHLANWSTLVFRQCGSVLVYLHVDVINYS